MHPFISTFLPTCSSPSLTVRVGRKARVMDSIKTSDRSYVSGSRWILPVAPQLLPPIHQHITAKPQSQLPWAGMKQTLTDAGWPYHSPERGANSKLKKKKNQITEKKAKIHTFLYG